MLGNVTTNLILVVFSVILSVQAVSARDIVGKVVGVADGDTITVLQNHRQYKIRLYGIDCPEKRQDFGNKAKKFTASLTHGKTARVVPYDIDKYGRTVGVVYVNDTNVNEQIIKAGYAWMYRKYCKESFCGDWLKLEEQSKTLGNGLWNHYNPMPPWEYRKNKRAPSTTKQKQDTALGGYHGNRKSHVFHSPRLPAIFN